MKISFRLAGVEDAHLEAYDNTKLVAYNTCPTWGILRYQMNKTMPNSGRAMALEAGSAMHHVFAWVRLMTLCRQLASEGRHAEAELAYITHGARLFGPDKFDYTKSELRFSPTLADSEWEQYTKETSLTILEASGFYDDDRDKRRTLSALEECTLVYVDRWRWPKVWMRDNADPAGDIGIEIPYDIVMEVEGYFDQSTGRNLVATKPIAPFRVTGKLDGIHHYVGGKLLVQDNKTASRLNDAWEQSFAMSTQITGYLVAASVFTSRQVRHAEILGLQIPIPKDVYAGFTRIPAAREDFHIQRWVRWLVDTVTHMRGHADNPYDTPHYTHSCNRYFRPCMFIPFCDSPDDERHEMVEHQMVTDEWSPLHEIGQE